MMMTENYTLGAKIMNTVKLLNSNRQKPLYTFNDGSFNAEVHTVNSMGVFDVYVVRKFEKFLNDASSGVLCKTVNDGETTIFFHPVPPYAKIAIRDWTDEEWREFLTLAHEKVKTIGSLEEVEKAIGSMPYFSDIRKLAKIKRNGLRNSKKQNQKQIDDFFQKAIDKGHSKIVFGDLND